MGQKVNSNLIRKDINQNFKFLSSSFNKFKKLNELLIILNILKAFSIKYNIQFNDLHIYTNLKNVNISYNISKLSGRYTLKKKIYYYIKWVALQQKLKNKLKFQNFRKKKLNKSNKYKIINQIIIKYLKKTLSKNININYFSSPIFLSKDLITSNLGVSLKKVKDGYKNIFFAKNIIKNYDFQLKKKLKNYILGYKIILSGRISNSKKASEIKIIKGRLPLQTFRHHILFSKRNITTKRGNIGLKLWILYSTNPKLKKLKTRKLKNLPNLPYIISFQKLNKIMRITINYRNSLYKKKKLHKKIYKLKKKPFSKIKKI